MVTSLSLEEALSKDYRFDVIADPEGGFVICFPDLPGCLTQVERIEEVGTAAEEIRTLWLETVAEAGQDIPAPTYPKPLNENGTKVSLQLQLSATAKARIARAAAIQQMSVRTFVTNAALREANAIIEQEDRIELTERDALFLMKLLESPTPPNERFKAAIASLAENQ